MWKGVKERYDCLKDTIQSAKLGAGMRRLPDEILLRIFEVGFDLERSRHPGPSITQGIESSNVYIRTLSHVCKRFRNTALGCRAFWTTIFTFQSKSEVEAFLQRSGGAGLMIVMDSDDNRQKFGVEPAWGKYQKKRDEILKLLFSETKRWEAIAVAFPKSGALHLLQEVFKENAVTLPRLKYLEIFGSTISIHKEDAVCRLAYWQAPNLQFIRCARVKLELAPKQFHLFQNISKIELVCTRASIILLLRAIRRGALTNLKELEFELRGIPDSNWEHVTMNNLEKLSIRMHKSNLMLRWFFHAPKLTTLYVESSKWNADIIPTLDAPALRFVTIDCPMRYERAPEILPDLAKLGKLKMIVMYTRRDEQRVRYPQDFRVNAKENYDLPVESYYYKKIIIQLKQRAPGYKNPVYGVWAAGNLKDAIV